MVLPRVGHVHLQHPLAIFVSTLPLFLLLSIPALPSPMGPPTHDLHGVAPRKGVSPPWKAAEGEMLGRALVQGEPGLPREGGHGGLRVVGGGPRGPHHVRWARAVAVPAGTGGPWYLCHHPNPRKRGKGILGRKKNMVNNYAPSRLKEQGSFN